MDSMIRKLGILCLGMLAAAITGCASSGATQCEATGVLCPSGTHCAAAEPICISDLNLCGNAHLDSGEVCDDGNTRDGDGCSHDCTSDETCDNGVIDTLVGEVCDGGPAAKVNGRSVDGDGCSADCKSDETCGNGIIDTVKGEVCDDGGNVDGDGDPGKRCAHDCKSDETCGNGIVDRAVGEKCDDGNTVDGDACSHCLFGPSCGNGVIDYDSQGNPTEECDDGNQDDNDDCRKDCVVNRCGDRHVNSAPGPNHEDCDDGDQIDTNGCTNQCKVAVCGDGILEAGVEECDDHNAVSGDGCSSDCKKEFCGDSAKNNQTASTHEDCDSGGANNDTCNFNCTKARCGDGIVNDQFKPDGVLPEQCDPPSIATGCSATCRFEHCGNGVKDPGEQCDKQDGVTGGQICSADCHIQQCGNGILDPGEECDDNNKLDDDACLSSSTSPATACKIAKCGDGKIQNGHEECDDGANNGQPTSTCSTTCHIVTCGNGVKEQGEECDDGNGSDADDCLSSGSSAATTCKIARCGDSQIDMVVLNGVRREDCDDGANNGKPGDRCSVTCHTATCGNGVIDQDENCDDGMGNNGPGKRCNGTCHINVCGDGDKSPSEQCDAGSVDMSGVAHRADGPLMGGGFCDDDCTLAVCGDGHKNTAAGEGCDDGAANGTTSQTCDSFCQLVACGNGHVDFGEQCDPGTGTMTPVPDSSTCDGDCTAVVCGDGRTNSKAGETCDEGARNGDPCGYGLQDCVRCNSTCDGTVSPGGPFCGDGRLTNNEMCDEGPRNGGECTYGDLTCLMGATSTVCNTSCNGFVSNPNGKFCGDGLVQLQFNEQCDPGGGLPTHDSMACDSDCSFPICGDGHTNTKLEACDDGNTDSCGSCSTDCQINTLAKATGSITAAAALMNGGNIADGNTFTLDDGFHTPVTFEFDVGGDGTVATGHKPIPLVGDGSESDVDVAGAIFTAVKKVHDPLTFAITAAHDAGSPIVSLTNDRKSSFGNKAIQRTGTITTSFTFVDLAGGAGGNCDMNVGCAIGDDCTSGTCDPTTHKCH